MTLSGISEVAHTSPEIAPSNQTFRSCFRPNFELRSNKLNSGQFLVSRVRKSAAGVVRGRLGAAAARGEGESHDDVCSQMTL